MELRRRRVKKRIKVMEGRGVGCRRWRNWRRRQQNKSTGDRNAQLSSDPEARIGAHVAGMRICPALIFLPGTVCTGIACLKKKKKKKSQTDTDVKMRQIHTCTHTLANDCGNTQNKCSKAKARCKAEMAWETIKRSNHINSGMTEGQRYAGLQKNGGRCFP